MLAGFRLCFKWSSVKALLGRSGCVDWERMWLVVSVQTTWTSGGGAGVAEAGLQAAVSRAGFPGRVFLKERFCCLKSIEKPLV